MPSASTVADARPASRATRPIWAWARVLGGLLILAFLVWRVGTGPFLAGVRVVNASALVAAFAIGVLSTVCCAWRWRLVAAGLGVRLPLREAVAAYYRSQFLNTTLPGGVLGDVHRAARHGKDIGDVGLGFRAVVLERSAGLAMQAAITVVVLAAFPSPVRSYLPVAAAIVVAAGLGGVLLARALPRSGSSWWPRSGSSWWPRSGPSRWARALHAAGDDIRMGLFSRHIWVGVLLTSTVTAAGYLTTFLIAARTAGSTAPLTQLVPLTMLALLAMGLPLNVAGWGPREGVAAWVFGAAGLTATQGVATSVTYGVLAFVASLPGAVVLLLRWINRVPGETPPTVPAQSQLAEPTRGAEFRESGARG